MRHDTVLKVASLLSVLFFSLHVADDVVRGIEPGTLTNYPAVLIFTAWLYTTVVLVGRRVGYALLLVASLLGSVVPVLHMSGRGLGGAVAASEGALPFIWTILALGTTSGLSVLLCLHGLLRRRHPAAEPVP